MMTSFSAGSSGLASLYLVTAVTLWSGNFIAGRWIGDGIDPLALNFWRWLIALVVLVPLCAGQWRRHRHVVRRSWRYLALLGLTGVAVFHLCVYQALGHLEAANALMMLCGAPALILFASRQLFGESVSARQWLGAWMSFLGAVVILCRGDWDILRRLEPGVGEAFMLVAVPAWVAYSLLLRRRPAELPQGVMLTASAAAGLLWMVPAVLLAPGILVVAWSPEIVRAVGYVAVGASVIAFLSFNRGVAIIGPARAGVFLHLMPVIGTVLAVTLLGEPLHEYHVVGAALVCVGISLGQWRTRRELAPS